MLALFSLLSIVAFAGVGSVVGWRIRGLAQASGREPERWISLSLLAICGVGYPMLVICPYLPWFLPIPAASLGAAGVNFGVAAIFLFTRCVFRPDVAWLARAIRATAVLLVFHWVAASLEMARDFLVGSPHLSPGRWTVLVAAVAGVGFGWTAWEALRYSAALRRRCRLGLADPLVVNRVALWGAVGLASCCINAVNAWTAYAEISVLADPFTMIVTGGLGLMNAICLWLAFLPPEPYAAWMRRAVPQRA